MEISLLMLQSLRRFRLVNLVGCVGGAPAGQSPVCASSQAGFHSRSPTILSNSFGKATWQK